MRLLLLLLTLSSLCVRSEVGAEPVKEETARLRPYRLKHEFGRAREGVYETWLHPTVAARRCKLGKRTILLFDVDGNGRFGDVGSDAWTIQHDAIRYAFVLRETIVLGGLRVWLTVGPRSKTLTWRIETSSLREQEVAGVALLNRLRMANGLEPVRIDEKLSADCAKHVYYMNVHGQTHVEEPGKKGYTKEGAEAGIQSVLSTGPAPRSVRRWWAQVFHRRTLVQPDTASVGIASSSLYTILDGMRGRKGTHWQGPVLVPAPNSTNVPTRFAVGERPPPHPRDMHPGFPITAHWPDGTRVEDAQGEIRRGGPTGVPVAFLLSTPASPAHASRRNNDAIVCLLPKAPLEANQRYWVRMAWSLGGQSHERTWTFRTAKVRK